MKIHYFYGHFPVRKLVNYQRVAKLVQKSPKPIFFLMGVISIVNGYQVELTHQLSLTPVVLR